MRVGLIGGCLSYPADFFECALRWASLTLPGSRWWVRYPSLTSGTTCDSHSPLLTLHLSASSVSAEDSLHCMPALFMRSCITVLLPLSMAPLPTNQPRSLYAG